MNGAYIATVRQVLDIAPLVFTTPHFAIKGGIALNLFLHNLPRSLTDHHRTVLVSLLQNQPCWDGLPFPHLQELPAIRWKLQNLAKLKGAKRAEQVERLQACFQKHGGML